jgi:hypothetical protein
MGVSLPSIVSPSVSSQMLPLRRHVPSRIPRIYSMSLASVAGVVAPAPYQIFDRYTKVLQKDRSAGPNLVENSRTVDYVRDEIADRLIERMLVSSGPGFFFVYLNASHIGYQAQVQYRTRSGIWPGPLRETAGD